MLKLKFKKKNNSQLFYLCYIFLPFYLTSLWGKEKSEPGVFGSLEPEPEPLEKNQVPKPEPLGKKSPGKKTGAGAA